METLLSEVNPLKMLRSNKVATKVRGASEKEPKQIKQTNKKQI